MAASTSGLSNLLDVLSKTSSLFGSKSSTTKSSSTISQDQLNAMIADQLSQTGGLADVTSGAHASGLYNDTVKSQLASQLTANVAAKVAEANRTTTSTTTVPASVSGGTIAKVLGAAQIGSKLLQTTPGKAVGKKLDDILGTSIFGDGTAAAGSGISTAAFTPMSNAAIPGFSNLLGENSGALSELLNPNSSGSGSNSNAGSNDITSTIGAGAVGSAFQPRAVPTVSVSIPGEYGAGQAASNTLIDSGSATAASSGVGLNDFTPYIGTAISAASANKTDQWGNTIGTGVGTFVGGLFDEPVAGAAIGGTLGSVYQPEFSSIYGPSSQSRKSINDLSEDVGNLDLGGLVTDGADLGFSGIQASTGISQSDQLEGLTNPSGLFGDAANRVSDVGGGIIDAVGGLVDSVKGVFSGGCFITTAVCEWKGMADDCEILQKLRAFRDGYMSSNPKFSSFVAQYYAEAPGIVTAVRHMGMKKQKMIWAEVFSRIEDAIKAIDHGYEFGAFCIYRDMFNWLKDECLQAELEGVN